MAELKSLIKKLGFLLASWVLTHLIFLSFHEQIHQEIFSAYHCHDIHTHYYALGLGARTYAICPQRSNEMVFLHALNEVLGYTIAALYTAFYFNLCLLILYRAFRKCL